MWEVRIGRTIAASSMKPVFGAVINMCLRGLKEGIYPHRMLVSHGHKLRVPYVSVPGTAVAMAEFASLKQLNLLLLEMIEKNEDFAAAMGMADELSQPFDPCKVSTPSMYAFRDEYLQAKRKQLSNEDVVALDHWDVLMEISKAPNPRKFVFHKGSHMFFADHFSDFDKHICSMLVPEGENKRNIQEYYSTPLMLELPNQQYLCQVIRERVNMGMLPKHREAVLMSANVVNKYYSWLYKLVGEERRIKEKAEELGLPKGKMVFTDLWYKLFSFDDDSNVVANVPYSMNYLDAAPDVTMDWNRNFKYMESFMAKSGLLGRLVYTIVLNTVARHHDVYTSFDAGRHELIGCYSIDTTSDKLKFGSFMSDQLRGVVYAKFNGHQIAIDIDGDGCGTIVYSRCLVNDNLEFVQADNFQRHNSIVVVGGLNNKWDMGLPEENQPKVYYPNPIVDALGDTWAKGLITSVSHYDENLNDFRNGTRLY